MSAGSAPLRVAVAGLGRAGIGHAALLGHVAGCELAGLADPRPAARAGARGMGFRVPMHGGVQRLLARTKPDALVVALPEPARPGAVRAAIKAGIPVLLQPPMAPTLAEAVHIVREADAAGVKLAVAHPLVHEPVFMRARTLVEAAPLGALRHASASLFMSRVFGPRPHVRPNHTAGGVVAQVGADLLLLLTAMLGRPARVRATWIRLFGPLEDELHGSLVLETGLEVGFDVSWSVPGYLRSATVIELHGPGGSLLATDDGVELELVAPAAGLPAGYTQLHQGALPHPARFDLGGEAPWIQLTSFIDWVRGGPAPPNAAHAALAVHRVVDALYASARANGDPVVVEAA